MIGSPFIKRDSVRENDAFQVLFVNFLIEETFLPVDQILNLVSNQNQIQNRMNNEISKLAQKMRTSAFSPDERFSVGNHGIARSDNFYENARDNSLFLSSEKKIRYPEEMNVKD